MKPAPFEYLAPRSLDEALGALARADGEAKILAGGQSLIPLLNFRLARPRLLVDLGRIPELSYVEPRDDGYAIGAMTTDRRVERDGRLATEVPLLTEAITCVGHPAIRSRGTLGGSLAHADPAAELPAVAVCLDAQLTIAGPRGERTVPAEDFFLGYLTTALEADEILTRAWFPARAPFTGHAWLELTRRHGDFALVGVGVSLTLASDCVREARVVLTGVGATPVRAREAEIVLVSGSVPERVEAAADAVRSAIDPEADIHASKEYRVHVAGVLAERAIRLAHARAVAPPPSALDVGRLLEDMARRA
jgi:carbon-monoxide dehydrogenase medium subunit